MSRIGKKPLPLPAGVDATVGSDSVTITGPKGTLTVKLPPASFVVSLAEPRSLEVSVANPAITKQNAIWGLTRQLLANAIAGVEKPFEKSLEFVGVGFKVALTGAHALTMDVGFSHPVPFTLPQGIEAKVDKQLLTLSGIDKHLVGEIAAQIRRIRPPEPYKGKGIKYTTETIRRKAGKAAVKSS